MVKEPFDVMDVGRMSVIKDPTGAVLCLWTPRKHIGAEVVNQPGALTWADVATSDAEGTQAFYTSLFGWSFAKMSEAPPYWVISNAGRSNRGMTVPPPGCRPTGSLFGVKDLDVTIEVARRPATHRSSGRSTSQRSFALLQDPQARPSQSSRAS